MTTALMEVCDALREAGASEERLRAAVEAVANYEHRLSTLGSDVTPLKWMAGFNLALSVAMIGILLRSLS
ncbi:MAG TPA: hypothetical protein VGO55_03720 [Allosphingosinicella sp.]|jgi:hypothetical protein|nr:hypothetical protein [Allosphingosinicella sp.]